jgi:hypothetical protein
VEGRFNRVGEKLDSLRSKVDKVEGSVETNYRNLHLVLDEVGKVRRAVGQ